MHPIVDTHQHLWDMDQFILPWLDSEGVEPLRNNYLMSDYLDTSAGSNVSKTVYMEVDVAPHQQVAEVDFVTGLCRQDDNPMAGAVVGGGVASPIGANSGSSLRSIRTGRPCSEKSYSTIGPICAASCPVSAVVRSGTVIWSPRSTSVPQAQLSSHSTSHVSS